MNNSNNNLNNTVEKCDTLLVNATVWSGKKPKPAQYWVAISDNRFVGMGDENTPLPKQSDNLLDLQCKHILPSFVDCHSHLSAAAFINYAGDASQWRSKDEALEIVKSDAALSGDKGWLIYFHADWTTWVGRKIPTAKALDEASGGRPVFLVCTSLHRGVLSESALKKYEISHAYKKSWTEFIDTKRGEPTGVVWEECFSYCLSRCLQDRAIELGKGKVEEGFRKEAQKHLSVGITDVHDPGVTDDVFHSMAKLNEATSLRISWSSAGNCGAVSSASKSNKLSQYGNGPSSAKVFTDGAHRCSLCINSTTAARMATLSIYDVLLTANLNPIRNLLQAKSTFKDGNLIQQGALFSKEELSVRVKELAEVNERLKIHAIGNHAIDMTCDCIVENDLTTSVCLEHATIVDDNNIEKISKNNILVSLQPGFIPHHGPLFEGANTGDVLRGLAANSMLKADINLSFSSDYPCAPLEPLHNMRCAVDRKTSDGRVYLENEAITQEQAVYAYTVGGMKGITGNDKDGIEIGAVADFVILSGDPFDESSIVENTWINGECVFEE